MRTLDIPLRRQMPALSPFLCATPGVAPSVTSPMVHSNHEQLCASVTARSMHACMKLLVSHTTQNTQTMS